MYIQSEGNLLLYKILQENRLKDFEGLDEKIFYQEEAKVFEFIEEYVKKYEQLPSIKLVVKETPLQKEKPEDSLGYYIDFVNNRALYNKIKDELIPVMEKYLKKDKALKATDVMREFLESEEVIKLNNKADSGLTTMQSLGSAVIDRHIESRTVSGLVGIPTGWPTLNRVTGGLQGGDVTLILARPKMGKSIAMLLMADAAHDAGNVPLIISMEMLNLQMANRFYAHKAKVNMTSLKMGQLSYWGEKQLRQAVNLFQSTQPFYILEGLFKKDLGEIVSLIRSLNPHAVYIDGGYLIKIAQNRKMATWEQMTEIAKGLKVGAVRTGIPWIVSFQFTREVKKSHTTAEFGNIQLADAIGQVASTGIGIFEENDPDESTTSGARRRVEIIGGREGESGGFSINWRWDSMDFSEVVDG